MFSVSNIIPEDETCRDLNVYLDEMWLQLFGKIIYELSEKTSAKWYIRIHIRLSRASSDGEEEFKPGYFRSELFWDFIEDTMAKHIEEVS